MASGLFIGIVGFFTIEMLLKLMGANGKTLELATSYMQIWFLGTAVISVPIMANGLLRAAGDGTSPAILMAGTAAVNVALNPILIFGWGPIPEFGMLGAAIATIAARSFSAVGAVFLLKKKKLICFDIKALAKGLQHWSEVLRIAGPASLSTSVNPMAISIATAAVATLGDTQVAAFGVVTKVQSMALIPLLALSSAAAPMAGQNSGAGQEERTRSMLKWCVGISIIWAVAAWVILFVCRDWLADQFLSSTEARQSFMLYMAIVPLSYAGYGVMIALSAAFNGLGRSLTALAIAGGRALGLLAPLSWVLVLMFGFVGIAAAMVATNIGAALGSILMIAYANFAVSKAKTAKA